MRKLMWICGSVSIVCALVVVLVVAMLNSPSGSQWIIRQAGARLLPGQLTVKNIQGNLLSDLSIDEIQYDVGALPIRIQQLKLRCSPVSLLTGKLQIKTLNIATIACAITKEINTIRDLGLEGVAARPLPITIAFDRAIVANLMVDVSNHHVEISDLNMKGRVEGSRLLVEGFEGRFNNSRIGLDGEYNLSAPFAYSGRFKWRYPLNDNLDSAGGCTFDGDVDQATVHIDIKEPFSILSSATVQRGPHGLILRGIESQAAQLVVDSAQLKPLAKPAGDRAWLVEMENLHAKTMDGLVIVNGHVSWDIDLNWALILQAERINPGSRFGDWPGELAIQATIEGRYADGIASLTIPKLNDKGQLLDQPIDLSGYASTANNQLTTADIRILSGDNSMSLKAGGQATHDLKIEFAIPDPLSLWPPFKGTFTGSGTVTDLYKIPKISLQVEGRQIKYTSATIETMRLDAQFTLNESMTSNATITMNQMQLIDKRYPSVSVTASGDINHQQVNGSIQSLDSHMDFNVHGQSNGYTWEFITDTATLSSSELGLWTLRDSVTIRLDRNTMEPFSACWERSKDFQCIEGNWRFDKGLTVQGAKEIPPFQFISDFTNKLMESREKKSPEA